VEQLVVDEEHLASDLDIVQRAGSTAASMEQGSDVTASSVAAATKAMAEDATMHTRS
jgi:hypothetical protein